MKNKLKKIATICLMALGVTVFMSGNAQAAKTNAGTVSYTLKNGTLTVQGKGKMPTTMTFKGNKKIKKVVIKKGVTSISDKAFQKCGNLTKVTIGDDVKKIGENAFYNCKKLKTVKIGKNVKTIADYAFYNTAVKSVTVPKKVSSMGAGVFYNCKKLKTLTLPGNIKNVGTPEYHRPSDKNKAFSDTIDTINFSTDVSTDFIKYCFAKNLNVSKNDKNYKSIDGVIYSKDGKTLVRVPERTELTVVDGCEEFLVDSVLYSPGLGDDNYLDHCFELKTIVLPKSVKKIRADRPSFNDGRVDSLSLEKFVIQNKELDMDSIVTLIHAFHWYDEDENLMKKNNVVLASIAGNFPERIKVENDMYITTDGLLLRYAGKAESLVIPDRVKVIDKYAFASYGLEAIKEIQIPGSVEKIEGTTFEKFKGKLVLSKNTVIQDKAKDSIYQVVYR